MATGKQTKNGKAFEYACAYVLWNKYSEYSQVFLQESPQLATARNAFQGLEAESRQRYLKGAEAAVKVLHELEPRLSKRMSPMTICLQADSAGIAGDVRDVICMRAKDGWEIGLSCKHNHDAVKHSRLSDKIDFGEEWFGHKCSSVYFDRVGAVFGTLRKLMAESVVPPLWNDIPDKAATCYIPVLEAFLDEVRRLDKAYPEEIPASLVKYLIGRNDFYKIVMDENKGYTKVEVFNMNGTLNKSDGNRKPRLDSCKITLPTRFYWMGFKEDSNNTVLIVCDKGWNISFRIHNANSKVEPSLKFDVTLEAVPNSIVAFWEIWKSLDDVSEQPWEDQWVAENGVYGTGKKR